MFKIKKNTHLYILAVTGIAFLLAWAAYSFFSPMDLIEDFQDTRLYGWKNEIDDGYGFNIVDTHARSGYKSARFELRSQQKRNEIYMASEPPFMEKWYSFSIYLPEDFAPDPNFVIVTQWHGTPDEDLGEPGRKPPLYLFIRDGRWHSEIRSHDLQVTTNEQSRIPSPPHGRYTYIDLGQCQTQRWTDWIFHVKWSLGDDGLVEIWKDGTPMFTEKGPNTYNDKKGVYLKVGLYTPGYRSERFHKKPRIAPKVIFYDSIKVGNRRAVFEDMLPPPIEKAY